MMMMVNYGFITMSTKIIPIEKEKITTMAILTAIMITFWIIIKITISSMTRND